VGKAQRFERRLQGMVGDAFARVFGGSVVPQEVAQALQREADDNARPLAGGRVLAPNRYTVTLGAADHDRLAALGYGAGGRIVLELASARVPFKALAAIHPGLPAARAEDWNNVGGAYLLCTGSEDPLCTPDQLFAFTSALQDAGVDWRVNVYGGAKHAFWAAPMHPDGSLTGGTTHVVATVPGVGHHALHATRAWQAVLDLLDETVGASSVSIQQP